MRYATHFTVQPGWRLLLQDMGINPAHILQLADLAADLFARKEARITPSEYFRLWQAIETSAGTASVPLMLGAAVSAEAFDPPIFASLCSPNLNVAMQRLSAFKRLIGPMALEVQVGPADTSLTLTCYGSDGPIPRSLAMSELVFLTQLVRLGSRTRIVPTKVALPDIPGSARDYAEYFGILPTMGRGIRLSFAKADAERPFLTENEAMWAFFEPDLRRKLSSLVSTSTMGDRVKAVLLESLPVGEYSAEYVSKHLAVSKRTLQRQLAEESTSFTELLNTTRRQLAQHYLKTAQVSYGEIAYLLGFQEVNSFLRAFKGWTGCTPSTYRSKHTAGPQDR
nr:AraC family transcriptional regulator ligand-binding domain-containing protein [uncultured Duganella sp.]